MRCAHIYLSTSLPKLKNPQLSNWNRWKYLEGTYNTFHFNKLTFSFSSLFPVKNCNSHILLYVTEGLVTLEDLGWTVKTWYSILVGASDRSLWFTSWMEMVEVKVVDTKTPLYNGIPDRWMLD